MAVKRVLQVLRRVTEFKEYVLVTFKEEGERLLSCNRAKLRKKLPSRALIDHGKERPLWKGGDY